jgi:hypothetical protein
VVLSFELWILSYLSRAGARETRGTKETRETIEIRAELAEIFRVDGERQWQQQEQKEEDNPHGILRKAEQAVDSAYSALGEPSKRVKNWWTQKRLLTPLLPLVFPKINTITNWLRHDFLIQDIFANGFPHIFITTVRL